MMDAKTTMIERVARAICQSQTQGAGFWKAFVPEARAAIAAMREPTAEIEDAIRRTDCWDPEEHTESYGHAWRYAIDAALEEKP